MLIETLSVFPEMFEPVMSTSILGRARKVGLFDFKAYNLRDWTHDRAVWRRAGHAHEGRAHCRGNRGH